MLLSRIKSIRPCLESEKICTEDLTIIASEGCSKEQELCSYLTHDTSTTPEQLRPLVCEARSTKQRITLWGSSDVNERDYDKRRQDIIRKEELRRAGGLLELSEKEGRVDQMLVQYKQLELRMGLRNPLKNAASMHFFNAKRLVEQSKVFQFLKKMPKGAVLHIHNTGSVSSAWVIGNLTYMPGMLMCYNREGSVLLTFRKNTQIHKCTTDYLVLQEERAKSKNVRRFDEMLEMKINMQKPLPEGEFLTSDQAWIKLEQLFVTLRDATKYIPAFKAFHYRMMEELYLDNVMYAEVRMRFRPLYDAGGVIVSEDDGIKVLLQLIDDFKSDHAGFLGIKIIYAVSRESDRETVRKSMAIFTRLHKMHPDFIIGFDLVGQEDKGNTLNYFSDILQLLPETARYFFHAGETNLYGASADLNLVDAVLLNTTRIGHGYALLKHPILLETARERKICIEVCPISNQVLDHVWDLRNHPASFFLSANIPMVVSNDVPGFFNTQGLSYDFYYTIMSFAAQNAGLKTLKHLVWNSIEFSALGAHEKLLAYEKLQQAWADFVILVLKGEVF